MNILFIHQNYPGQYVHLAAAMAQNPRHQVVAIGEQKTRPDFSYSVLTYSMPQGTATSTHHYIQDFERHVRRGQQIFRACLELKNTGFFPDIICGHPGWGETLFVKDVYPQAKLLIYCEFYYRAQGSDIGFDPEYPSSLDTTLKIRIKNSTQLHSLVACDAGISPTSWQRRQYPKEFREKIHPVHDGINTQKACPDTHATLSLGQGKPTLSIGDEVVTYVARNLEPYRGFHSFMRAIPQILIQRPNAHVVIIGGEDVSYGLRLPEGETYKERYLKEVRLDADRVHFLGRVPYETYLNALRVSSAHVYLTYPFVLSWSCLEAMSVGCVLIASRTPPVEEVLIDGETGLLVDFFSAEEISDRVCEALSRKKEMKHLRDNARALIQSRYDLHRVTLPQQMELINDLVSSPRSTPLFFKSP
ncbi:MAG: glycosyltransferase family 4 protein [Desulfobulbus sp.]|nr:glycosyltransferase family 4 protein [Desulfobulbus sp.]